MKVLLNCGPWLRLPAPGYGGRENVEYDEADGAAEEGLDIEFSLFTVGETARHPDIRRLNVIKEVKFHFPEGLYYDPGFMNGDTRGWIDEAHALAVWQWLESQAAKGQKIDLIHDHTDFGFSTIVAVTQNRPPVLMTLHGSLNAPFVAGYLDLLKNVKGLYFNSISDNQRKDKPDLPFIATVYNGVNIRNFPYQEAKDDYLFIIGRITRDKGQDRAVKVARRLKTSLIIVGEYEKTREGQEYWEQLKSEIDVFVHEDKEPLLSARQVLRDGKPQIIYYGPAGFEDKVVLYKGASCLLMPISWEEPFGLVMAEAGACGTPVVAFRRGAAPEIIEDGKTGFLVKNTREMIEAAGRIHQISPRACRERVETHFSARVMARNYYRVYEEILAREQARKTD